MKTGSQTIPPLVRRSSHALLVVALVSSCDAKDGKEAKGAKADVAGKAEANPAAADPDPPAMTTPPADAEPAKAAPESPKKARPPLELPGKTIALPAKPNFPKSTAPAHYKDGAWSIAGLRKDIDGNVAEGNAGTEVELRATVQEIYVPPPCPPAGECPPPKQPHVWVVDDPADKSKRHAMLVVNYAFQIPSWDAERWEDQPDVVLEVGREYTFKGKFKQFSDTGFSFDRGLLEFVAVKQAAPDGSLVWVYPPGAPWHPMEIARFEAENAALMEKAKRAAGG